MPLRQFLWERDWHGMHLTLCETRTFNVINLSSIRFPYAVTFEDRRIINPEANGQCKIVLDVSDLDGNDIKIKNSDDCVFVEGKREFYDGRSWKLYQVCRRLPLPVGYQVKSVHSKHASYGKIALTVIMHGMWDGVPGTCSATKTVLMCEGALTLVNRNVMVKLNKIQPKVVSYGTRRELTGPGVNPNYSRPMIQTEDSDSDESVEQNEQSNFEINYIDSQVQVGMSYCNKNPKITTRILKDASGTDEGPRASSYGEVVFSRRMVEPVPSEKSESEGEQSREELLTADNRRPAVVPKTVWAVLTSPNEVKINMDWEQGKAYRSMCSERVR